MTITINKKKYNIRYTIRALFIWESITGKPFALTTILDNYIFFYSMLLANNPDAVLQWDDFVDALDNDKKLIDQLNGFMLAQEKKNNVFEEVEGDKDSKKK